MAAWWKAGPEDEDPQAQNPVDDNLDDTQDPDAWDEVDS